MDCVYLTRGAGHGGSLCAWLSCTVALFSAGSSHEEQMNIFARAHMLGVIEETLEDVCAYEQWRPMRTFLFCRIRALAALVI